MAVCSADQWLWLANLLEKDDSHATDVILLVPDLEDGASAKAGLVLKLRLGLVLGSGLGLGSRSRLIKVRG